MTTTASTLDGSRREPELWTYELFGCFDDFKLCIFTFLVPCYTAGRNAEAIGEDGCVVGRSSMLWCNLYAYGDNTVIKSEYSENI